MCQRSTRERQPVTVMAGYFAPSRQCGAGAVPPSPMPRPAGGARRVGLAGSLCATLFLAACGGASPSPAPSDAAAGPASPTPRLPPAASATPVPSESSSTASLPSGAPDAGGPSRLVDHGDRASNEVALTFTVGNRVEPAVEIVELLIEAEVPATIFMSGVVFDRDDTRADAEEVLRLVAERPDLLQLGQHGYAARELAELPADAVAAEVQGAERTMARYGVTELRPYFSPPGGAWSSEMLSVLGSLDYPVSVLWDVDPLDWLPPDQGGPSADEIASRVLHGAQGGSIVLLHLGGWNTFPALPAIIEGLAERGLRPVTVAQLLRGD